MTRSCLHIVKRQHKKALQRLTDSLNPPIELGTDMTLLYCWVDGVCQAF